MIVYQICGGAGSGKSYVGELITKYYSSIGLTYARVALATEIKTLSWRYLGISKSSMRRTPCSSDIVWKEMEHILSTCATTATLINSSQNPIQLNMPLRTALCDIRSDEKLQLLVSNITKAHNTPGTIDVKEIGRLTLQFIGTELIRTYISPNYWKAVVVHKAKGLVNLDFACMIVDDYRFHNEDLTTNNIDGIKVVRIRVDAPLDVRASRLGITIDELIEMSTHPSEVSFPTLPVDFTVDNSAMPDIPISEQVKLILQKVEDFGIK